MQLHNTLNKWKYTFNVNVITYLNKNMSIPQTSTTIIQKLIATSNLKQHGAQINTNVFSCC